MQVLHKVLVVLGVHALQDSQHDGKELAHQSRIPIQGVGCLHHGAEQDDHYVPNVIVRGAHIRPEQKFQYVVHDVDALGNLTIKNDILTMVVMEMEGGLLKGSFIQVIVFNLSKLGIFLLNT